MSKQNEIFCDLMRSKREKLKLSFDELGMIAGIEPSQIKSWEKYGRAPRVGTAMKWAHALGYNLKLERIRNG